MQCPNVKKHCNSKFSIQTSNGLSHMWTLHHIKYQLQSTKTVLSAATRHDVISCYPKLTVFILSKCRWCKTNPNLCPICLNLLPTTWFPLPTHKTQVITDHLWHFKHLNFSAYVTAQTVPYDGCVYIEYWLHILQKWGRIIQFNIKWRGCLPVLRKTKYTVNLNCENLM
jgi:hypothetical protein